jgi:hypothetical protein
MHWQSRGSSYIMLNNWQPPQRDVETHGEKNEDEEDHQYPEAHQGTRVKKCSFTVQRPVSSKK